MELAEGVVGRERDRGYRVPGRGRSRRPRAPGARVEETGRDALAHDGTAAPVGPLTSEQFEASVQAQRIRRLGRRRAPGAGAGM